MPPKYSFISRPGSPRKSPNEYSLVTRVAEISARPDSDRCRCSAACRRRHPRRAHRGHCQRARRRQGFPLPPAHRHGPRAVQPGPGPAQPGVRHGWHARHV